jgi:hypothetical protein
MAKKTVRVATWAYLNKQKKRRRAYFGDVLDLSPAEIRRGEAAGVFDQPEADGEPASGPDGPDGSPESTGDTAGTSENTPGGDDAGDGSDDLAGLAGDGDAQAAGDPAAGAAPLAKPLNTALDEQWVAYAVSKGFDQAEAEKMVKEDRAGLIKALA